ncbi:hypothetical protein ABZY81_42275 [Streptomyces sp. NPDC006514]|uniref:cyanobactin maturation protease PatG family protein n=1 Tax=Streptomyces sp. NPDC006514 TaxID=3154308 RepID=UPI0033B7624D
MAYDIQAQHDPAAAVGSTTSPDAPQAVAEEAVLHPKPVQPPPRLALIEPTAGLTTASDPCPSCATAATEQRAADYAEPAVGLAVPHVYAIGRIEARFPRLSVEKEFAQVSGRADTAGQTDNQLLRSVLDEHRYLARKMCWVLLIREIETYILLPRDPGDLELLVDSIRPDPDPLALDVVIGRRGPVASPDLCNGLTVPLALIDQIYSFDRESFRKSIPKPVAMTDEQFRLVAGQVLDLILTATDNAGSADEHRALNYLAMRYPEIYIRTAQAFADDFSLSGVTVRRSQLGGSRTVVDCVFAYTSRRAGFTEKAAVSVDVTDEFPFLVAPLSTYYDR